jgi:hypothetical protein
MYTIKPITAKQRVEVVFDDFRDHNAERFRSDLQSAVRTVKRQHEEFDILVDMTKSVVMPQEIARQSEVNAQWLNANGLRKSANIVETITQRMQVKRVTSQDDRYRFFETRTEAEAWFDS